MFVDGVAFGSVRTFSSSRLSPLFPFFSRIHARAPRLFTFSPCLLLSLHTFTCTAQLWSTPAGALTSFPPDAADIADLAQKYGILYLGKGGIDITFTLFTTLRKPLLCDSDPDGTRGMVRDVYESDTLIKYRV